MANHSQDPQHVFHLDSRLRNANNNGYANSKKQITAYLLHVFFVVVCNRHVISNIRVSLVL